jgi:hypothetical protein
MCQQNYCSLCVVDGFLNSHVRKYKTKDTQFCNCVECQLPPQVTAVFSLVRKSGRDMTKLKRNLSVWRGYKKGCPRNVCTFCTISTV